MYLLIGVLIFFTPTIPTHKLPLVVKGEFTSEKKCEKAGRILEHKFFQIYDTEWKWRCERSH